METFTIPTDLNNEQQADFEDYLRRQEYEFKRIKKSHRNEITGYIITVPDAMNAFWIGCNYVAKINGLFKGPLTK